MVAQESEDWEQHQTLQPNSSQTNQRTSPGLQDYRLSRRVYTLEQRESITFGAITPPCVTSRSIRNRCTIIDIKEMACINQINGLNLEQHSDGFSQAGSELVSGANQ